MPVTSFEFATAGRTLAGAGRAAAALYPLSATAELNDIDPRAWVADLLARLPDHPVRRFSELLPWNWGRQNAVAEARAS